MNTTTEGATMTTTMQTVIDFAKENGGMVVAGNNVSRKGSVVRVPASTLRALAKRGILTLSISPDGGMMGRLV